MDEPLSCGVVRSCTLILLRCVRCSQLMVNHTLLLDESRQLPVHIIRPLIRLTPLDPLTGQGLKHQHYLFHHIAHVRFLLNIFTTDFLEK
jgi:hypothetical protein